MGNEPVLLVRKIDQLLGKHFQEEPPWMFDYFFQSILMILTLGISLSEFLAWLEVATIGNNSQFSLLGINVGNRCTESVTQTCSYIQEDWWEVELTSDFQTDKLTNKILCCILCCILCLCCLLSCQAWQ